MKAETKVLLVILALATFTAAKIIELPTSGAVGWIVDGLRNRLIEEISNTIKLAFATVKLINLNPDFDSQELSGLKDLRKGVQGLAAAFLILYVTYFGVKYTSYAGSPAGRAENKERAYKLVFGLILVAIAPYLYTFALWIGESLSYSLIGDSINDSAVNAQDGFTEVVAAAAYTGLCLIPFTAIGLILGVMTMA
ncbi:MAG: hypothetical protein R6T78_02995, partial [Dehalococcoidales bacterium]